MSKITISPGVAVTFVLGDGTKFIVSVPSDTQDKLRVYRFPGGEIEFKQPANNAIYIQPKREEDGTDNRT